MIGMMQNMNAVNMIRVGLATGISQASAMLGTLDQWSESDVGVALSILDNVEIAVQRLEEIGLGPSPLTHRLLAPSHLQGDVNQLVRQAALTTDMSHKGWDPESAIRDDFAQINRLIAALLLGVPYDAVADDQLPLSSRESSAIASLAARSWEMAERQEELMHLSLVEFASSLQPSVTSLEETDETADDGESAPILFFSADILGASRATVSEELAARGVFVDPGDLFGSLDALATDAWGQPDGDTEDRELI